MQIGDEVLIRAKIKRIDGNSLITETQSGEKFFAKAEDIYNLQSPQRKENFLKRFERRY